MKAPLTHTNTAADNGVVRCGLPFARVRLWSADPADATCNNCVRCNAVDRKKEANQ